MNDKNPEGVDKRSETGFKEISGNIWQKVAKIGKNTEGVNKRAETDLKEISSDIWQKVAKIGKILRG